MPRRNILILEDDEDRACGFRSAVASLGRVVGVGIWRDAPTMIPECPACFAKVCLISLDHDVVGMPIEPARNRPAKSKARGKLAKPHRWCKVISRAVASFFEAGQALNPTSKKNRRNKQ